MSKKTFHPSIIVTLIVALVFAIVPFEKASAAYNGDKLIDNAQFLNSLSMSINDVQSHIASKGGGIANMSFPLTCYGNGSREWQLYTSIGAPCGQTIPTSNIIYYAAQVYGVSPQVILATLQKEQSLVTTPNPDSWQINQAMGYGCPTSGSCSDSSNFFYQIDNGTWALRYHYERARGNNDWWTPSSGWNPCGTAKDFYTPNLYPGQNVNFYDENGVMYRTHYLHNAATSALYCYTPHAYNNPQGLYDRPAYGTVGLYYSGSYNFVYWFERWFDPAATIRGSMGMTIISQPSSYPARGQTISYTVSFKNNLTESITLNAVGIVGRLEDINSGANRDMGWQGPITFAAGETKQFTFTSIVRDVGTTYVWPAVNYQGVYVHYNNWGSTLVSHTPNFTLSQPLANNPSTVYAGQNVTFSAVLKNNESQNISYDSIGIPVKFYDHYNYDAVWTGPGTVAPGGEVTLSGTRNIDKPGPFTYWVSSYFGGTFSTIGPVKKFTSQEVIPNFSVSGLSFNSTTPAQGENLTATFTVTNNLPVPITVDGVGVVGRYGTFSGPNRDIGWQGPITFAAGETKSFGGYSRAITDVGTHYYWIGVFDNGGFLQYNNWGSTVVSHQ